MALNKRTARNPPSGNKFYSAFTNATQMNWDTKTDPCRTTKGTKPLPDPVTIKQVVLMVIMHLCRKIVFVNTHLKVGVYLAALFFGSIISDFIPLPRTYFSQKTNFFNVYFVKIGWFWTLLLVGCFVLLSSYVYCCGDKSCVRRHLSRLLIATVIWYTWTSLFVYIETVTGFCSAKPDLLNTKYLCTKNGYRWYGFDISGHAFLLIYSSMIIIEEARSMRGWERIADLIRNDAYDEDSPLKCLKDHELIKLKVSYDYLGTYVKSLFIAITLLSILWDFMLVCTILYFHSMAQKLVGGMIALLMWFVTYHLWYLNDDISPGLPGKGCFRYQDIRPFEFRMRMMRCNREATNKNENQCD